MPGDNPLLPAIPDLVFYGMIGVIAVAVLAFIGGAIAVSVVVVRRANSGQPLDLLAPTGSRNSLMNQSVADAQLMQQQMLMQQQLQQQIVQQQIQNSTTDGR